MRRFVYGFGAGEADGHGEMRDLLGGKGANLAEMTRAGIPVPPGFTLTTEVCGRYSESGEIPREVERQIDEAVELLESRMGRKFGDKKDPLLVSVRSGARISMPGMMDTVLNLGMNDTVARALAKKMDPRFAWDAYRRFIQMFGDVVFGVPHHDFEAALKAARKRAGVKTDADLSAADLQALVKTYKAIFKKATKKALPTSPRDQLSASIEAVFGSWGNDRARRYRNIHHIPHDLGTACTVQAMVFGNLGEKSATGVGFTRDPATGEHVLYGEFLVNAQGEDVVAGIRTPRPLAELESELPEAFADLAEIAERLERHYGEMQDFEFTIEDGVLFMLQTRTGKRTGLAAVRIATDMVDEGLITREEAVIRVEPVQLLQLLHPVFDPKARSAHPAVARGLNASPGAACGKVCFTADEAEARGNKGEKVILVRQETSPDDIHGMAAAVGVLTAAGGMTSHAAVVGRQMGKPSVVGCEALSVDADAGEMVVGGHTVKAGDDLSIDGTTGEVILAALPTTPSEVVRVVRGELNPEKSVLFQAFDRLMGWADLLRRLKVRANADRGDDARLAVGFGAEGIGLCRTEHMFFGDDRLPTMREMILARDEGERRRALKRLLPMQRKDFESLFKAMDGLPVTIRTLDPPLHEFLPDATELKVEIAVRKATGKTRGGAAKKLKELETLLERVEELTEFNPMLGWRGCRLGIAYPEITEMQARAIFEAAAKCIAKGLEVEPEIMVPLVGEVEELRRQKAVIDATARAVMKEKGVHVPYKVGTMIEVPRGAVTAGEIAEVAEFFSFGTNDLTQTTFGYSRDDAGKFLLRYVDDGILPRDPFVSIDRKGVGRLMELAFTEGRQARQALKVGICGEHGGDPQSVGFCHDLGLDYVSCSPFRIPVARLAAAQAVLHERGVEELRARARRNRRAKQPPTYHGTIHGTSPRRVREELS